MQNHLIIMALSFLTIAISTQGNSGCLAGENKVVEDLWICDDWADEKPQTAEEQYQEMLNDSKYSEEDLQEFYYKISLHIERRLKPHKYGIVEVVKSGKKQRNVGNSYFIPAPLLHHYSYT